MRRTPRKWSKSCRPTWASCADLRLKRAWTRLDLLYEETEELFKRVKATPDICELRNMINVGYLITRQAMQRKESRGLHYTIDYPKHAYDQN